MLPFLVSAALAGEVTVHAEAFDRTLDIALHDVAPCATQEVTVTDEHGATWKARLVAAATASGANWSQLDLEYQDRATTWSVRPTFLAAEGEPATFVIGGTGKTKKVSVTTTGFVAGVGQCPPRELSEEPATTR